MGKTRFLGSRNRQDACSTVEEERSPFVLLLYRFGLASRLTHQTRSALAKQASIGHCN
ncbi:MAG: hypothetical protein SXA11_17900 [Cyanobacteriota bacterium]|nr:hypothetical protein [Cyanobacteriota bacterium]